MYLTDAGGAALEGIKVIDASNLIAGPVAGMLLADYGADVIKIEHPQAGDPLRSHGESKAGEPLWWKQIGRNKRSLTLNLSQPAGQAVLKRLCRTADILLESYRPGVFDSWGLSWAELSAVNPGLIVVHVSAFGRSGPMRERPGFGTLAESMSGFAFRNGQPDGPPTLPPFGLGDNVTGVTAAFGALLALQARERTQRGQEVDVSIIRSMLSILEPQILEYDQLGSIMTRMGSRSQMNAPRNLYRASDGIWIAISTSTQETANRMLRLIGHPEVLNEEWFQSAGGRALHTDFLDKIVGEWVGQHPAGEVLTMCAEARTTASLIYDVSDIVTDPQYLETETVVTVPDPALGRVRMPNVPVVLSETPGTIKWTGPGQGAHTDEILGEFGFTRGEIDQLRADGNI